MLLLAAAFLFWLQAVRICGLGTFYSGKVKVPVGNKQRLLIRKPGFQLSKNVAEVHRLESADMHMPGRKTQ